MANRKSGVHCETIFPTLVVKDVKKTANYYKKKLGFHIHFLWGKPPVHAGVGLGDVSIHFSKGRQQSDGYWVYFVVDDVDKLHRRFRKKGVKCLDKPENKPWDMREFSVKDLDGHHLRFGQPSFGTVGLAVPMSKPRYTCRESAETTVMGQ